MREREGMWLYKLLYQGGSIIAHSTQGSVQDGISARHATKRYGKNSFQDLHT